MIEPSQQVGQPTSIAPTDSMRLDECPPRTVAVSVVVPVVHRARELPRCLAALYAQSLPGSLFEIVVADGDPFGPISLAVCVEVDRFRGRRPDGPRVHYMPAVRAWGDAAARNAGWRIAAAPIVAFVEPDEAPDSEWLRAGLMSLAAGWDATDLVPGHHAGGPATSCFVRKRALDAVGGILGGAASGSETPILCSRGWRPGGSPCGAARNCVGPACRWSCRARPTDVVRASAGGPSQARHHGWRSPSPRPAC